MITPEQVAPPQRKKFTFRRYPTITTDEEVHLNVTAWAFESGYYFLTRRGVTIGVPLRDRYVIMEDMPADE